MRRTCLVLFGLVLSGCMEAQPSPAMMQLQGACQAGNLQACEAVVAEERARRAAIAEVFSGPIPQAQIIPPPTYAPLQRPTQTNCYALGHSLNCTTW